MPTVRLRAPKAFHDGFDRIRQELDVPKRFPADVLDEAEASTLSADDVESRLDARSVPLVAIDPPGATDLDQAFSAQRRGDGYEVSYAIADVAPFLRPGGATDLEARRRGTTLYSPDTRTPLHPPILSEDRASLLAGSDKPALLWRIELDGDGLPTDWRLERAMVRTRAAISYGEAQAHIDGGTEPAETAEAENLALLAEIGRLRQAREADRGGISINLPGQEIVEYSGRYALEFDETLPVEGWNAQISLLTGIVAATTMTDASVGILRTLPPPYSRAVRELRHTARALGLDWPDETSYPSFIRRLTPNSAACNTFLLQATRTLRGAGYVGFNGDVPERSEHGAIAAVYSHVTAPLRRLVDRFGNEILLALLNDRQPPAWAVEALDELPSLMGRARQRESALERAMVDFAEALILEPHVGEIFPGFVIDVDEKRGRARIQIAKPAVVAPVDAEGRSLAEAVDLKLDAVDVPNRTVTFNVVS